MTRPSELAETVSFGEAAAIGRIERALFGGDAELVRVGRYNIVERIGAGAFGRVYRAEDPHLGRMIALKVLDAEGPALNDDLLGEAKVMATVGHPNVAAVFDAGVIGETRRVFIAMELVKGKSLREWFGSPHAVKEIIDVLSQAGQGLAAAHAAGVVHRDVKPENVLVGDEGRVRVVDFGLARSHAVPDGEERTSSRDVTVTRTGTIAGTPAYMAPELFEGAPASVASDQFAFCTTLWEALYGARPYQGGSIDELRGAHARPLVDPPRRPRVPRAITRALARGLSRDPAARFPTMEALLATVAVAGWGRKLVLVAVPSAIVVGLVVGAAVARPGDPPAVCPRPTQELAGIWDAPRKAAIAEAFRSTGAPNAPASFARASQMLDHETTVWLDAHQDACEATHVRHAESPALLDRRMACLRDWRRRLIVLTDRMAHATPTLVALIGRAIGELPGLARCSDAAELEAGPPRPSDPTIAKTVEKLEDRLVEAQISYIFNEPGEALAVVEAIARDATAIGYEPTQVYAFLRQAQILIALGRYDEAKATARKCFDLALGVRDYRSAAIAASVIAEPAVYDASQAVEALQWIRTGESLRAKLDNTDEIAATLAHVEGNVHLTRADSVRAKEAFGRALAAWKRLDNEHPNAPATLAMLGIAELNLGNVDAASADLLESNRLTESQLGSNHGSLAAGLINYGLVELARGHYTDAAAAFDRGLELQIAALGETHPLVGYTRLNRGQLASAMGDRERADRELGLAREIAVASQGEQHAVTVVISLASGEHFARSGRGELAREHARRALAAAGPEDHEVRALALATLAFAELGHDPKAARTSAHAAVTEVEAAQRATPSQRAIAYDLAGETLLALGDRDGALAALRMADKQTGGPPDALRTTRIRFALARATSDRALARTVLAALPDAIDPALKSAISKLAR